jgi:hypothetical protein
LSEFGALGRGQILFADDGARVGLDAEVVAFFCGFEPGAVGFGAFVGKVAVGRGGLIVAHGEVEAHRQVGTNGLHGGFAFGVRSEEAVASFLRVGGEEAGEVGRVERSTRFQERLLEHLRHAAALGARECELVEKLRDVGLVESGGEVDHVAEMLGSAFAIAGVTIRGGGVLPGAFFGEPERHGEVRVRDE